MLKIGDKIIIKNGRLLPNINNVGWGFSMDKYVGIETYITKEIRFCSVMLNIDKGDWLWDKSWLEKVEGRMEQDIYKVISDLVHYLSYSRDLTAEEKDMAVKATTNTLSKKILAEFALQNKIFCLAVDNAVHVDTGALIFEEFGKLLERRKESKIKGMTN